jgi:hypothetical protein
LRGESEKVVASKKKGFGCVGKGSDVASKKKDLFAWGKVQLLPLKKRICLRETQNQREKLLPLVLFGQVKCWSSRDPTRSI